MGRKRDRHTDGQTEKEVDMGRKMGIQTDVWPDRQTRKLTWVERQTNGWTYIQESGQTGKWMNRQFR